MIDVKTLKSILSSDGHYIHTECINCMGLDAALMHFRSASELKKIVDRLFELQTTSIPLTFCDCGMLFDAQAQSICRMGNGDKLACTFYPGEYCAKHRHVLDRLTK